MKAVICRSRGGLSANEKKEKFASNDNMLSLVIGIFTFMTHELGVSFYSRAEHLKIWGGWEVKEWTVLSISLEKWGLKQP